jgi:hypothetical protein
MKYISTSLVLVVVLGLSAGVSAAGPGAVEEQGRSPFESVCTADCGDLEPVSCQGDRCTAVNRACPSEDGYVECDGTYTYCGPPTCPECVDGDSQVSWPGTCCYIWDIYDWGEEKETKLCFRGRWSTMVECVDTTTCDHLHDP